MLNLGPPPPTHTHTHTRMSQFLGSDSVSNATGDAAAADCMKRLRQAHKRVKVQLPKVTITLQFKGLTVFDERSKVHTHT